MTALVALCEQVNKYAAPNVTQSDDYLHLIELEEALFKDIKNCDVGIVWNQVWNPSDACPLSIVMCGRPVETIASHDDAQRRRVWLIEMVPSQVGSAGFSKGAKNDQRLINQLAMGLPVVVYSEYAAFADDADDMWYERRDRPEWCIREDAWGSVSRSGRPRGAFHRARVVSSTQRTLLRPIKPIRMW